MGALKIWVDPASGRFNTEKRGQFLGEFDTGDLIISLYQDGTYQLTNPDPVLKVQINSLLHVAKLSEESVVTALYYDGEKGWSIAKRFQIETSTLDERVPFIGEHPKSKLIYATTKVGVEIEYFVMRNKKKEEWAVVLDDFIEVKGWKARGNKLSDYVVKGVTEIGDDDAPDDTEKDDDELKTGDTIELDF